MAAQFPPELFENIVHFLRGGNMSFFKEEARAHRSEAPLKLSKRELGACSLVCWCWARRIRGNIFERLALRSRDDVLAFTALITSTFWHADSGFRIGMHVWHLQLEQDIHSLPWIHLVLHCLPHHLLPNMNNGFCDTITVLLKGSTGESQGSGGLVEDLTKYCAPPSIYHGLPRRLPLTPSTLQRVDITNTTFRSFNDFISFVSGIATWSLQCSSVRPLDAELLDTRILPNILHTKPRQTPRYVGVRNCTPIWPFFWTVTTCRLPLNQSWRRRHIPAVYFVPSELVNMAALIKCLFDDCKCTLCSDRTLTDNDSGSGANFWVSRANPAAYRTIEMSKWILSEGSNHAAHNMTVILSPSGFVVALGLIPFPKGQTLEGHLCSPLHTLNIDWRTIDTLVSQFATDSQSALKLEIYVHTESTDDMRAFAPYVRSQMPLLSTAARIAFQFTSQLRHNTFEYDWTLWTDELEHVEDSEDGTNVETGGTETALQRPHSAPEI